MAAMDRLPRVLRSALWESVVNWDPRWIRWELNKLIKAGVAHDHAARLVVARLQTDELAEIRGFSHDWPARFGRYPHVAAGATIQRYGTRAE